MKIESAIPIRVKGIVEIRAKMPGWAWAARMAITLTTAIAASLRAMRGRIEPCTVKMISWKLGCDRTIIFRGMSFACLPAFPSAARRNELPSGFEDEANDLRDSPQRQNAGRPD
ncbi:hypothetical protein WR25_06513 [Diploscapter pachys]|uniref:Uncharacterized protein n=1 Tax=Diploscapter pachys TaxID=2018661 RepID=A0A2A2JXB4_9BILA|nr:hypothetical protein WR25_06513 [Diploscapter pachys]